MLPTSLVMPILLLVVAALLAACGGPAPTADVVRPVRVLVVAPTPALAGTELAGEVRARVETRAGFQVPGRITERLVEVGQEVKSGAPLASLDPQDFRLAQEAAQAGLTAAQADRDQQRADYSRFTELQRQGFISAADLERRKATLDAAEARWRQADASARQSGNQAGYTTLRAPHDAVVVAVDAEAGQVVAAGQSVLRLARSGDKEVAVAVPEQLLPLVRSPQAVQVRLWTGGGPIAGKVREVAPVADAATRTFPVRIRLLDPPPQVALGMSATVALAAPATAPVVKLPLQALLLQDGRTQVWLLDRASGTVRLQPVEPGLAMGNEIVITQGLAAGDTVVTAGVHQLQPGQRVKVLGAPPLAAPAAAPATPS